MIGSQIYESMKDIMTVILQNKTACALLGLSTSHLAQKLDIGIANIRLYEKQEGLPQWNFQKVMNIKEILEVAGIEFICDPLKSPGVILHKYAK